MATRFHGRKNRDVAPNRDAEGQAGFGEWWAAIAVLSLAALAIVSLSGSAGPAIPSGAAPEAAAAKTSALIDASPIMLESIETAQDSLGAIEEAFALLCREPVLLAIGLEPDCKTGVITLPDELFGGFGSTTLTRESQEEIAAAMRIFLARLRGLPALWNSLEFIEIRGHSDPSAVRAPYTTNLIGSQKRPVALLLFLMSSQGLSEPDQADLQKLAVVSGVSYSRPPADCAEDDHSCYPKWRRVEIRPVLSESLRRGDWSRTLEEVRVTARRIQQGLQTKEP